MTAAEIHRWPMASAANAAQQRLDAGRGSLADQRCLAAWDSKVRRHGSPAMAFDSANGLEDTEDEPNVGTPDDPITGFYKWLAAHLDPADLGQAENLLEGVVNATSASGWAADEPLRIPKMGGALAPAGEKRTTAMVSAVREMQAIRRAEAEVLPHVGEVVGLDSAGATYEAALRRLGHDTRALRPFPSAMQSAFRAAVRRGNQPRIAMDAKTQRSFAEQFPGATKLKVR